MKMLGAKESFPERSIRKNRRTPLASGQYLDTILRSQVPQLGSVPLRIPMIIIITALVVDADIFISMFSHCNLGYHQ